MYWVSRLLIICLAQASVSMAHAVDTDTQSAASLRTKYGVLQDQLRNNPFQKPLYLDSSEKSGSVAGDMYALIDHPFATVSTALNVPTHWCDILILHLNTKYCRASTTGQGTVLNVSIGKKYDQPIEDAYRVPFTYRVAQRSADYLQIQLRADEGPLGTRDYRITLEAVAIDARHSFIHLTYAYSYGQIGRAHV